jgi:hypothetical protein
MRLLPRKLRTRFYYSIAAAGAQVGWSRSSAYRAKERGDLPTKKMGRFELVPRKQWDRTRERLLRGQREARRFRPKAASDDA